MSNEKHIEIIAIARRIHEIHTFHKLISIRDLSTCIFLWIYMLRVRLHFYAAYLDHVLQVWTAVVFLVSGLARGCLDSHVKYKCDSVIYMCK